MSILTGPEIRRVYEARQHIDGKPVLPYIKIDPIYAKFGPNSIDVHLSDQLLVYDESPDTRDTYWDSVRNRYFNVLDTRKPNPTKQIPFLREGFVFMPGQVYLGSTVEYVECHGLVPYLDGRSSVARLSVFVHCTAGRGDDAFRGNVTFEISVVRPVKMYPGDRIGQLTFHTTVGERLEYDGRYQGSVGPVGSKMHEG